MHSDHEDHEGSHDGESNHGESSKGGANWGAARKGMQKRAVLMRATSAIHAYEPSSDSEETVHLEKIKELQREKAILAGELAVAKEELDHMEEKLTQASRVQEDRRTSHHEPEHHLPLQLTKETKRREDGRRGDEGQHGLPRQHSGLAFGACPSIRANGDDDKRAAKVAEITEQLKVAEVIRDTLMVERDEALHERDALAQQCEVAIGMYEEELSSLRNEVHHLVELLQAEEASGQALQWRVTELEEVLHARAISDALMTHAGEHTDSHHEPSAHKGVGKLNAVGAHAADATRSIKERSGVGSQDDIAQSSLCNAADGAHHSVENLSLVPDPADACTSPKPGSLAEEFHAVPGPSTSNASPMQAAAPDLMRDGHSQVSSSARQAIFKAQPNGFAARSLEPFRRSSWPPSSPYYAAFTGAVPMLAAPTPIQPTDTSLAQNRRSIRDFARKHRNRAKAAEQEAGLRAVVSQLKHSNRAKAAEEEAAGLRKVVLELKQSIATANASKKAEKKHESDTPSLFPAGFVDGIKAMTQNASDNVLLLVAEDKASDGLAQPSCTTCGAQEEDNVPSLFPSGVLSAIQSPKSFMSSPASQETQSNSPRKSWFPEGPANTLKPLLPEGLLDDSKSTPQPDASPQKDAGETVKSLFPKGLFETVQGASQPDVGNGSQASLFPKGLLESVQGASQPEVDSVSQARPSLSSPKASSRMQGKQAFDSSVDASHVHSRLQKRRLKSTCSSSMAGNLTQSSAS